MCQGINNEAPKYDLSHFGFQISPLKKFSEKEIRAKIIEMIVLDLEPISVVDNIGFKRFVNCAWPEFSIPSRTTVSRLIEGDYESKIDIVKNELSNVRFIASTTDGWENEFNHHTFCTVTIHYLDPTDEIQLKSRVLNTVEFGLLNHTAVNIANKLEEVYDRWQIRCKK